MNENQLIRQVIAHLSQIETILGGLKSNTDYLSNIPDLIDDITIFLLETLKKNERTN